MEKLIIIKRELDDLANLLRSAFLATNALDDEADAMGALINVISDKLDEVRDVVLGEIDAECEYVNRKAPEPSNT